MRMRSAVIGTALMMLAAPAAAQVPGPKPGGAGLLLEVVGGVGTTVVDVDKWAGTTNTADWGTVAYGGTARLFFLPLGARARLGAEVGYLYLFWWSVPAPGQSYNYTYDATASRASGVVRWSLGPRAALDAGVGAYVFDGGTDIGAHLAAGYHVPLGPKLTLPVQVRADYLLDDPAPLVIALHVGLGFRL